MNKIKSKNSLAEQSVEAIKLVIGSRPAVLHEPSFDGNEWTYVKECLDSTYVSSVGKFVDQFESDLASYTGAKHVIAVVNGTAALHAALLLAGVEKADEVLVPALTFVATANAVSYCGAVPHFVDCNETTLGIDPVKLRDYLKRTVNIQGKQCINRETGRRIRAIVPMHTFGHPVDMDALMAVANDYNLLVIEDASESLGSTVNGCHTGTFGLMGTLSFNGNKTITTGGGGAILTNDSSLASRAKHLTTTAKLPHPWEYVHDEVGYNYRLPNINAALGCAQLEKLPQFIEANRKLYQKYNQAFSKIENMSIFCEPEACKSNYWLQTLMLDYDLLSQRDEILRLTNSLGIMTRPIWRLLHKLEPYKNCPRMELTTSESLEQRIISLPSSSYLGME